MAVVFDTGEIVAKERADATCTAMQENSAPSNVRLEDPNAVVSVMEVWPYGQTSIFRSRMSGVRLLRTDKQARRTPSQVLAIAVQETAVARHRQLGVTRLVSPGELMVVDLNSPYDYEWNRFGSSRCLHVPIDEIGLPYERIQQAAANPERSPVARMLADHISTLTVRGDELSTDPSAYDLGQVSIDLARAMLASAVPHAATRDILAETLLTRVRAYVRRHLANPALSAQSIAVAHGISTRRLYQICAEADLSLEQWIIARRLAGARAELSRPEIGPVPIATVARRWGFVSHAHFTRRFRAAYAVTPSEWRRRCAESAVRGET